MGRELAIGALLLPLGCSLLVSVDGLTGGAEPDAGDAGALDGFVPPDGGTNDGSPNDGSPACGANVASDPDNCGACGHSCRGTACENGLCRVLVLADKLAKPACVAVDTAGVHWTEQQASATAGAARSVLKSGTGASPPLGPKGTDKTYKACRLRPDGEFHFTGSFGWGWVTADGTNFFNPVGTTGAVGQPDGLAFTATGEPFFTDEAAGCLLACQTGCPSYTFDTVRCGLPGPFGIAATKDAMYVTMRGGGTIVKVDPKDGGLTTLVSDQGQPGRIAVDSSAMYWANAAGQIMKAGLDGGAPTVLAESQDAPTGITVDETSVYWATANGGTVVKVAKGGGVPVILARNQDQAWDVAVDADSVYWVTRVADGGVFRTAK